MLCQNCNKNKATVKYTQIINDNKKEMMLCEECSQKLGISKMSFNMPIDFSNFFGEMLSDYENSDFMPMISKIKELKCDNCNMTYDEFINIGKLGCPECYTAFSDKIDPILRRIHGSDRYLGRKINNKSKLSDKNIEDKEKTKVKKEETKKQKLERNLKNAILQERYEDAAKIRDEIKNLKEE